MFNETERDFIEFMAQRSDEPVSAVQKRYEASKRTIDFGGNDFGRHGSLHLRMLQVFFNDESERSLFESYRYYAYQDMLRMLSYSFSKLPTVGGYLRTFSKALRTGDFGKVISFLKRRTERQNKKPLAESLLNGYVSPTILDYGCGLGYLSLEMAEKSKTSKVILVDLDTIKLDFAEFRFKKRGVNFETIRIGIDNPYPVLPAHTICIATDVMEHLRKPLVAYKHIHDSMQKGGTLYGNFEDHRPEMFHVHPVMNDLRDAIAKDYREVAPNIYKKI